MSDLAELREQLRRAEERTATLRQRNAQLEHELLKPTKTRNRAIAVVATALLGGTLAYLGASRSGDARGARVRAYAAEVHQSELRASSRQTESCKLQLQTLENAEVRCQNERAEIERWLPQDLPPVDQRGMPCKCQAGDPLCSCF